MSKPKRCPNCGFACGFYRGICNNCGYELGTIGPG